ncbi:MAG: hypothetical protein IT262_22600 [Saprospiraceae bacterium]|nr:hypothetical protein [Saprospiraceae bacterium]
MKKKLQVLLLKMEYIQELEMGQLQGGFASLSVRSETQSVRETNKDCPTTNNCKGSNCIYGCSGI